MVVTHPYQSKLITQLPSCYWKGELIDMGYCTLHIKNSGMAQTQICHVIVVPEGWK